MTESRLDPRCDIAFRVVQSEVFHDECKVDVQHVCEEHIKVPVVHHEHLLAPPPSYLPPPSLGQVGGVILQAGGHQDLHQSPRDCG